MTSSFGSIARLTIFGASGEEPGVPPAIQVSNVL